MSAIPEKHIEFCRAIAKLAKEAGIDRASITFNPGIHDEWRDEIQMHWSQGRHGEDSRRIYVTSTVQVRAELTVPNAEIRG
jgi:hypothetical protein